MPEIAGFQGYEYLRNNEADLRHDFMTNDSADLELLYPALADKRYAGVAAETRETLRILMKRGGDNEKTAALYDAIEYRFAEMALVDLASQLTDPETPEAERGDIIEWFKATNEALYGRPDEGLFHAVASQKIAPLLERTFPEESIESSVQTELADLIGEIEQSETLPYRASEETVGRLHGLVTERFGGLVDHIDPAKVYAPEEIVGVLDSALGKIGGKDLGWRADIAKDSSALAVSAHQRLAEVGANRKAIGGEELKAKVIHEIGVHALRSITAEQAGWLSAAYGQDGYLAFEEALATALEDAYKGKFEDHGVNYYLIAGLALGIDSGEPRDFREVYEVMWRVNALSDNTDSLGEEQLKSAKSRAFNNCLRMFRGTRTTDKGVIYSKDLAYFAGQELAWSVLDGVDPRKTSKACCSESSI